VSIATPKTLTGKHFHVLIATPGVVTIAMNETETSGVRNAEEDERLTTPRPELRDLVPLAAGGKLFAVFAENVEGVAEAKPLARLPNAPASILGVVCVRGRMLTVLDPVAICTSQAAKWAAPLPCVVVLRGDEQLAVAAETCRDMITIANADILTDEDDPDSKPAVLGVVRHAGEEITVLSIGDLFAAAMQRRERRRRRL
jgi:purine-binding chemotaxis protein CheW